MVVDQSSFCWTTKLGLYDVIINYVTDMDVKVNPVYKTSVNDR